MRTVKPWDIPVVVFLLLLCFIPTAVFTLQHKSTNPDNNLYAVISIDSKTVKKISLSDNSRHYKFNLYPHDGEYNLIEVDGGRIRDKEDNTPDQIAVHTGWISKAGQQSICLPHKLIIEIKSYNPGSKSSSDTGLVQP